MELRTLNGHAWACPDMSAVDTLNVISYERAVMRPLTTTLLCQLVLLYLSLSVFVPNFTYLSEIIAVSCSIIRDLN